MHTSHPRRLPSFECQRPAPFVLVSLLATLAMLAPASAQGPSALLHSLFDPGTNAQAGAQQGRSVALDGNIAVTGAPSDDMGAQDSGVVKVYNATTGALLHTLINPSPAWDDNFGNSVAVSGTRVVVGTPGPYYKAGSAYVYDLASATPTVPVATLHHPSPVAGDQFGNSVAVSGTRVVVGAQFDDTGATDAGSAYVYDLASATPTVPVATLNNPSSQVYGDDFGISVAVSGARVVVGAPGPFTAGSAYVYDLASATPTVPVATLNSPRPANDSFGNSVAVSGTRVVVGAYSVDTLTADRAAAYVFSVGPLLRIVPAAPGFATVSWTPINSPGFVLQYSDSFVPTNWLNFLSGATNPATIRTIRASRFYRLFQP